MSGRCKEGSEIKKRWYLLVIAAGLLLCAVSIRFFQRLPKPVFALVAAGGAQLVVAEGGRFTGSQPVAG